MTETTVLTAERPSDDQFDRDFTAGCRAPDWGERSCTAAIEELHAEATRARAGEATLLAALEAAQEALVKAEWERDETFTALTTAEGALDVAGGRADRANAERDEALARRKDALDSLSAMTLKRDALVAERDAMVLESANLAARVAELEGALAAATERNKAWRERAWTVIAAHDRFMESAHYSVTYRDSDSEALDVARLTQIGKLRALAAALPEQAPGMETCARDVWRCSGCGEMLDNPPGTAWRWNGKAWEHRCPERDPQAGYEPAKNFGPRVAPGQAPRTDDAKVRERLARLEWAFPALDGRGSCFYCLRVREEGHVGGCPVAEVLAQSPPRTADEARPALPWPATANAMHACADAFPDVEVGHIYNVCEHPTTAEHRTRDLALVTCLDCLREIAWQRGEHLGSARPADVGAAPPASTGVAEFDAQMRRELGLEAPPASTGTDIGKCATCVRARDDSCARMHKTEIGPLVCPDYQGNSEAPTGTAPDLSRFGDMAAEEARKLGVAGDPLCARDLGGVLPCAHRKSEHRPQCCGNQPGETICPCHLFVSPGAGESEGAP